jgi:thymidylate synthase (FAD)
MEVRLIAHTPNPEKVIAIAAKMCYYPGDHDDLLYIGDEEAKKFVKRVMSIGHHSVIEHVNFTFMITGIDRTVTHQLVRHRLASYSQKSQRFVNEEEFGYTIPECILEDDAILDIYRTHMHDVETCYTNMRDLLLKKKLHEDIYSSIPKDNIAINYMDVIGKDVVDYPAHMDSVEYKKIYDRASKWAQENARLVLSNSVESDIVFTMNARSLLNFFAERMCMRAQDSIRDMANKIYKICRGTSPTIFEDYGPKCKSLLYCPENGMQHENCIGKIPTKHKIKDYLSNNSIIG